MRLELQGRLFLPMAVVRPDWIPRKGGNVMEAISMNAVQDVNQLVGKVHEASEPVVVFDGDDECLVAMRPADFERILFDSSLLNCSDRESIAL